MTYKGIEFFENLIEIHSEQTAIADKYPKMRTLLERVCKDLTTNDSNQFSNLFSRLNYVCQITQLDKRTKYHLNTFRVNANNVLHDGFIPSIENYKSDLKALCNSLSHFYNVDIPIVLLEFLPNFYQPNPTPQLIAKIERMRVLVEEMNDNYILVFDEDTPTEEPIKVKYNVNGINSEFNDSVKRIKKGFLLNLINVTVTDGNIYTPNFIVIEPDYLMDISSIAENFKEHGNHPLNYIKSQYEGLPKSVSIILGNYANNVFDEFLFSSQFDTITYNDIFSKTFKQYPFDFSVCKDFNNPSTEATFRQDLKSQFDNIKKTVLNKFIEPEINIDRLKAVVEPSFICEKLGIQGRMDFLQENYTNLIELKSGKADDFMAPTTSKENHYIQMLLYLGVLEFNLSKPHNEVNSYLFYSRYPLLYKEEAAWNILKGAINVRNQIVCNEIEIATIDSASSKIITSITPENLNIKNLTGNLWDKFIKPQISEFKAPFSNATPLELVYFHSFNNFVAREHILAKLRSNNIQENRNTSYWLDFDSKAENGEILYDLSITPGGNKADSNTEPPTISLTIPEYDTEYLPNFREGDIVILYERNNKNDNVTNKQIFKGTIQKLSPQEITIRIRFKQRNLKVLPLNSKYAVEHDFLDSSFNSMYRGLYSFLQANPERKQLLLNQRPLNFDTTLSLRGNYSFHGGIENAEINRIVLKAKQAKDYFILVGPPGTGKTSIVLKSLVEEFLCEENFNILLLSYTNRAVDEICDALDNIEGNPDYIRVGTELSCEARHRNRLIDNQILNCNTREEVRKLINSYRIFVGTVSSFSSKSEIFKLKHFNVAIVDEASQILEPCLLGILSYIYENDVNAVDKFILIGDHKQLPAVVLQSDEESQVTNHSLNNIFLFNRRFSLFERLYNIQKSIKNSLALDMLHYQGRMHEDIVLFPNYLFYNNQLKTLPLPRLSENLQYAVVESINPFQQLIATKRIAFIPSERHPSDKNYKVNTYEAKIVSKLISEIFILCNLNGIELVAEEPKKDDSLRNKKLSIGVITPYRNQIALIKREINNLNIASLNDITVDTVERYQGSQRDIIIYSFSVNQYYQLENLAVNLEVDGQSIDRKLNVAITRAKKQLFITGNPEILSSNLIYYRFIEFIRSNAAFINAYPDEFLKGNFLIKEPDINQDFQGIVYFPDNNFVTIFDEIVINPLRNDPRSNFPNIILGFDSNYNRNNVIEYGMTKFDQATIEHSSQDKVMLYCYFNLRMHFISSLAIFSNFFDLFNNSFINTNNRITFIDFGCGPLTSGLAFQQCFNMIYNFHFEYIGIDISNAMLEKAKQFASSGYFNINSRFQFNSQLEYISDDYWNCNLLLSNTIILNFSYLFANLSKEETEKLADKINSLINLNPLNKFFLVYQNSLLEKKNRNYMVFKKLVKRLNAIIPATTEKIVYKNTPTGNFYKHLEVYYEILSN